jgi:quercetin dioxygenase-like cupin family protein
MQPRFDFVARIHRHDVPGIREMHVEGKIRDLGAVKNFRNHPYLKHHLPSDVSISWTHLDEGQRLEPHTHPVPSMVIIASGQGRSIGDSEVGFCGGDVVYIPEHNSHGFVGGEGGFWALSVQFQETAIFETEVDPLTQYAQLEEINDVKPLQVIKRENLDSLHEVEVDGEIHRLGLVKNFASHPVMRDFLPEHLSLAWVRLGRGETLHTHRHPEDSMILVTEGEGSAMGGISGYLKEGDVVYVPEGHPHGFSGEGDGFWALSVQFSKTSLYYRPTRDR